MGYEGASLGGRDSYYGNAGFFIISVYKGRYQRARFAARLINAVRPVLPLTEGLGEGIESGGVGDGTKFVSGMGQTGRGLLGEPRGRDTPAAHIGLPHE